MLITRNYLVRYTRKRYKEITKKHITLKRLRLVLLAFEEIIAEQLGNQQPIKLQKFGALFAKRYRWKGQVFYIPKFRPYPKFNNELNKTRDRF